MEKFSIRLQSEQILFRYARGTYEREEKEFHTQHELFFLLGGETEFISETGRQKVPQNTLVLVPKETFHQFVVLGDETAYTRCVFKFGEMVDLEELIGQKMGSVCFLQSEELTALFGRLTRLCHGTYSGLEKQILLKAYLAEILVATNPTQAQIDPQNDFLSPLTKSAIQYIRHHLSQPLSLQQVAEQLHVSPSCLSHRFKADMQISLHKYILNKRLILANKKILRGLPAQQAAEDCGFRDYSNFFTQYKKRFGHPPSQSTTPSELHEASLV